MTLRKTFAYLAIPLLLQGCATLSKEECLHSDWRLIGFEDGSRGKSQQRIGEHRSACAEYGVTPDLNLYRQGWDEGIIEFCRPQTGYQQGLKGYDYKGVCPRHLEAGFLDGFYYGQRIHDTERKLRQLNRDYNHMEQEYQQLTDQINQKQTLLISDQSTPEMRLKLLSEIKDSTQRQGEIKSELTQLSVQQGKLEHAIQQLRQDSPYF